MKNDKDVKELQSSNARSKGDTIEKKNEEIETENESKEADKDLVSGFNNIMSDLFGSKGKQESDTLREQTDAKKANNISVPNVNIPDGEQESSDDIPPLIVPMKRGRKNLRKTKGSGTTIMVIEKPVESSSNMSGPAMSGGKTKTLNIDAMKKSGKNIMKKLHKIILQ